MAQFTFDKNKLSFVKKEKTAFSIVLIVLKWIAVSFLIALLFYGIIALLFSTDREKHISAENEYMEQQYEKMSQQLEQIDEVISGLEVRDQQIYKDVFNSPPPSYENEDTTRLDISSLYLQSYTDIVWITHKANVDISNEIHRTEQNIELIDSYLKKAGSTIVSLPSIIPVKNFNIAQTGASIGMKVSPFLKNFANHDGLDIMAPLGTDVLATADGVVTQVQKNQRGFGNKIEITHADGYVTSYSHLNDIFVSKGQSIKQGSVIGRVGSTGMSFATHLHYSVFKDGKAVDPLNYFFAELNPDDYRAMITMSMNTGQSMD